MKLTHEQTNKILNKLEDNRLFVINTEDIDLFNIHTVSEEYFNERVNEALEDDEE